LKNFGKTPKNSIRETAPFLRLLIPLILGILAEKNFPFYPSFLVPLFCLSTLIAIFFNLVKFPQLYPLVWMAGIAIQIAIFSIGRLIVNIHQDIQIEQSSCYTSDRSNLLLLRLLTNPVPREKSWKAVAGIIYLVDDGSCYIEDEKILVFFDNKLDMQHVSAGSILIVQKKIQPIQNIKSIDFDFKSYCRLRHIYAQIFLKKNELHVIGQEEERTVTTMFSGFRQKLLSIIKKQIPGKTERGFLEALLFGFTEDLDPELLSSYADTGVIHIIAISGLHLALICQLLQKALLGPGRRKFSQWLKFSILIVTLWSYSIFSGSSPSVIRAAAMFTLVLFGRNIRRESLFYNTMAVSAFFLLCFDPNWLWDTGFQLSYGALLGLRLFSAPLQNLIPIKNKILKAIWHGATVSVAAQMLTTPISIFYFHRFPTYFLIANLIAVPLSSAILLGGILLCIFCWNPHVAGFLGWTLDLEIKILNDIIRYISKLPGSLISPLSLTLPQVICLYFMIYCLYRYIIQKLNTWFLLALSAIAIFQISQLIQ
jgi:competence protein ComEC